MNMGLYVALVTKKPPTQQMLSFFTQIKEKF